MEAGHEANDVSLGDQHKLYAAQDHGQTGDLIGIGASGRPGIAEAYGAPAADGLHMTRVTPVSSPRGINSNCHRQRQDFRRGIVGGPGRHRVHQHKRYGRPRPVPGGSGPALLEPDAAGGPVLPGWGRRGPFAWVGGRPQGHGASGSSVGAAGEKGWRSCTAGGPEHVAR